MRKNLKKKSLLIKEKLIKTEELLNQQLESLDDELQITHKEINWTSFHSKKIDIIEER